MRRFLVAVLLLAILFPSASAQAEIKDISVMVYSNGYVKVQEIVMPSNYSVVVNVPLLGNDPVGISVYDENNEPLLFEYNGSTLIVYVPNVTTQITVTYFTASLTSKEGEIWSLSYSFPYPVTIELPSGAVVVDLSDVPLRITSNSITMPPGNQSVSYLLPLPTSPTTSSTISSQPSTTTTTTTLPSDTQSITSTVATTSTVASTVIASESTTASESNVGSSSYPVNILFMVGFVMIVATLLAYWRKKDNNSRNLPVPREEFKKKLEELDLTDEEIKVLLYVYDLGGKAKQADVRKALGIPKTTAWRMFKRLEERGLVKIYRRGKDNWVQLVLSQF